MALFLVHAQSRNTRASLFHMQCLRGGFDHHCDIIDVCIGTRNLGRFRVFLLYHAAVTVYAAYVHVTYIGFQNILSKETQTPTVIVIAIELNLAITLTLFALFHMCLWALGIRTIDVCRLCFKFRARREASKV